MGNTKVINMLKTRIDRLNIKIEDLIKQQIIVSTKLDIYRNEWFITKNTLSLIEEESENQND